MMQRPVISGHGIFERTKFGEVIVNKVLQHLQRTLASSGPGWGGGK